MKCSGVQESPTDIKRREIQELTAELTQLKAVRRHYVNELVHTERNRDVAVDYAVDVRQDVMQFIIRRRNKLDERIVKISTQLADRGAL